MERFVLGHHLRAIAQFVRAEKASALEKRINQKKKLTGFAKDLQDFIEQLPHLSAEAAGRESWGFIKKFKNYGFMLRVEGNSIPDDMGETKIEKHFAPLSEYCLKHNLGLHVRLDGNDLEVVLAWEKPSTDGWAYREKPEQWLVPYNLS